MYDARRQSGVIGASLQLGRPDYANNGGGQNGRRRSHDVLTSCGEGSFCGSRIVHKRWSSVGQTQKTPARRSKKSCTFAT
eukprot:411939-Pyramimonas_sp.AAC.1